MALKVVELLVDDALTGETRVEEIALVLQPAIETEFVYFNEQTFQESYSDYPESVKNNAQKVLNWVETNGWGSCGTAVGKQRANQLAKGEAISLDTIQRMFSYLSRHKQDLVSSKSYEDGCGLLMYDSWGGSEALPWAEKKLRQIEQNMGYDVGSLSPYIQTTGTTETFEPPCWEGYVMVGWKEKDGQRVPNCVPEEKMSEVNDCGCGCWNDGTYPTEDNKLYFGDTMINGMPVFDTIAEAEAAAENYGCSGSHIHIIDGKEVYMPCDVHPKEDEQMCGCGTEDYTPEEFEAAKLLQFLAHNHPEKFEAVISSMNGSTEQEIYARNHTRPTTYFLYKRLLDGNPDRDFCMSIEGRYFRRLEIDLLRDTNKDFGHKKQAYSKWLYKGGPECVHAWQKFMFQGKDKIDRGMADGLAGTPPKAMPNNGYYSAETKRKSQQAYIISQQQMNKQSSSAIIVDIDDTLLRGGAPIQKTKDYINRKYDTNRIIVISGRQNSRLSETKRELDRAEIKYDEIHLSDFPPGPNSSNAFKAYKAKKLQEQGYKIVEAIENNADARREYTKLGIKAISPVSLSAQSKLEFKVDGERRMIYSPAMKPGILIPRIDEATKERYFVTFKPDTIETMAQRYMIEKRSGGGHTNYEHSDHKFQDVYLVESWIVEGGQDKAYALGYTEQQVPKGTWMVGFRVDSDEVWNMVKDGEIKGISIEGNFEYKFSLQDADEYLLKEIINIINQIQ